MINKISDNAIIVFIGSFNPGIFHPSWFETNGLLLKKDIEDAKIEVITNDVAIFTMSWVRIDVVGERFMARTNDESKFGPLRDLVIGTFNLLEFTPVKQMGINRELGFQFSDEETWHSVGHKLAPKGPWQNHVKMPGMKLLTMEAQRDDDQKGIFNISVASALHKSIVVSFNDHFDLNEDSTAADACKIVANDWDKSLTRAKKISTAIISNNS